MAAVIDLSQSSSIYGPNSPQVPRITWTKNCNSYGFSRSRSWKPTFHRSSIYRLISSNKQFLGGCYVPLKDGICVLSRDVASQSLTVEVLDAWEDEYNGVVIDPEGLPPGANAFASALRAFLSNWKLKIWSLQVKFDALASEGAYCISKPSYKRRNWYVFGIAFCSKETTDQKPFHLEYIGKKGVWLKIQQEQSELVPIAIQEGFNYHQAKLGYLMLTYWLRNGKCMLPGSPSHQISIAGFVINDKKQILVVKEKCPCSCSGVWKLPTGYINKSEEIFAGAVREVNEETGVETIFLEMVAFRHAHRLAFEKSDLQFVCMLKPLSLDIIIVENEIQDAKWITYEELIGQAFYDEDEIVQKSY